MVVGTAMRTPADESDLPPVAVMWENFGPTHHDRLRALAKAGFSVTAIELHATSRTYQWEREEGAHYAVRTLSESTVISGPVLFWRLLRACRKSGAKDFFFCHYQSVPILAVAVILRLLGHRICTMMDSKFDDYQRYLWREVGKSIFLMPYSGAIVASRRSRDYLVFLGVPANSIYLGYDTIDTARLRAAARTDEAPEPFNSRPFLVVARLVPKKNIPYVLEAFARYRDRYADGRELHLIGYGPMDAELAAEAERLGLGSAVRFLGMLPSAEVANAMAGALALILASTEEQFGLVVNEALAVGLPVIVTSNAGATDVLVENLGNGIVIDPHEPESLVRAMAHVAADEARWNAMRSRARELASRADATAFAESAKQFVRQRRP